MRSLRMLALATLVLAAGLAAAHEIDAPAAVQADGAGHFVYDVTVSITTPIEFGYSYTNGTDNTDIGEWYADGFCQVVLDPGVYVYPVEGNLVDVGSNGSVYYEHSMCDGWMGTVTTVILAPTVGAEQRSWTAVKGLYR